MQKLLIIGGCTAVGKSAFALNLSKFLNMEIISADSVQVYKGIEVATSKPTKQEESICPHHLINIVSPFETFNAFDFVNLAKKAIGDIAKREKLPVIVGGTGLYIDSLIYGFDFVNKTKNPVEFDFKFIFLEQNRQELYKKIDARVDKMLQNGLVQEVKKLREIGLNMDCQCMQAIGYKEIWQYLEGEIEYDEAVELIKRNTRNYAKRQITWFGHNDCERWDISDQEKLTNYLIDLYPEYHKKA